MYPLKGLYAIPRGILPTRILSITVPIFALSAAEKLYEAAKSVADPWAVDENTMAKNKTATETVTLIIVNWLLLATFHIIGRIIIRY